MCRGNATLGTMFRRDITAPRLRMHPSQDRPLTGSEMEAAAERGKWAGRVKATERAVGVLAVFGALLGALVGSKPVKQACDLAIVALAIFGLAMRRKYSSSSSKVVRAVGGRAKFKETTC